MPIYPPDQDQLIQLKTLLRVRWAAILGQSVAILVAWLIFAMDLPLVPIIGVIGLQLASNSWLCLAYPGQRRTSTGFVTALMVIDIIQLGVLLGLTGGLDNPFTLLILAPVTISSAFLSPRAAIVVAVAAWAVVGALGVASLPLQDASGGTLQMPPVLRQGIWVGLVIAIGFIGVYARWVASEIQTMNVALIATQEALAREQKLTDLAGVVAATAHELGTPLATMKVVTGELIDQLPDRPDLREDARVIDAQIDRCRDIMRAMGQAAKADSILDHVPIQALVDEAAAPHLERGVKIRTIIDTQTPPQPSVARRPELMHGLRNLVQNAVDYAQSQVEIDIAWTEDQITIRVMDDGPGFPPALIHRLGEPLTRSPGFLRAPGESGMGLGLFISRTLLSRFGARLEFANRRAPDHGAIVRVHWNRTA